MKPVSPLTDKDYQRLSATLQRLAAQGAMSLEKMDGFFAALLCGPEALPPAACLPLVLGAAFDDDDSFTSAKSLEQFVALLGRYWQEISHTLRQGEAFHPWLEANADGVVLGNQWADGFSEGMRLFNDDWAQVFDHPALSLALAPIMALAFEHDPDPDMRPFLGEVTQAQREAWLAEITPAVGSFHAFFSAHRAVLEAEYGDD